MPPPRGLGMSRNASASDSKPKSDDGEIIDLTFDDDSEDSEGSSHSVTDENPTAVAARPSGIDEEDDDLSENELIRGISVAQREKRKHEADAPPYLPRAQSTIPSKSIPKNAFQSLFGSSLKSGLRYTFATQRKAAPKEIAVSKEVCNAKNAEGDTVAEEKKNKEDHIAGRPSTTFSRTEQQRSHQTDSRRKEATIPRNRPPDTQINESQASKDVAEPRPVKRARVGESVLAPVERAASIEPTRSAPKKGHPSYAELLADKKKKAAKRALPVATQLAAPEPTQAVVPETFLLPIPEDGPSNRFLPAHLARVKAIQSVQDVLNGDVQLAGTQPKHPKVVNSASTGHRQFANVDPSLSRSFDAHDFLSGKTKETAVEIDDSSLFGSESPTPPKNKESTRRRVSHGKKQVSIASGSLKRRKKKKGHASSCGGAHIPRSNAVDDQISVRSGRHGNRGSLVKSRAVANKSSPKRVTKSRTTDQVAWDLLVDTPDDCSHVDPGTRNTTGPPPAHDQQKEDDWQWDLISRTRNKQQEDREARRLRKKVPLTSTVDERLMDRDDVRRPQRDDINHEAARPNDPTSASPLRPTVSRPDISVHRLQRPLIRPPAPCDPPPSIEGFADEAIRSNALPTTSVSQPTPTNDNAASGRRPGPAKAVVLSKADLSVAMAQMKTLQARHRPLEKPATLLVNSLPAGSQMPKHDHLARSRAIQNIKNRQYARVQSDQQTLKKQMTARLRRLRREAEKDHPGATDEFREGIVQQKFTLYKEKKEKQILSGLDRERREVPGPGSLERDQGATFDGEEVDLELNNDRFTQVLEAFGVDQSIAMYTVYLTKPYVEEKGCEDCLIRVKAFGKLEAANNYAKQLFECRVKYWHSRLSVENTASNELIQSWAGGMDKPLRGQAKLGDGRNLFVMVQQESQLVGSLDVGMQQTIRVSKELAAIYAPRYDICCAKTYPKAWDIVSTKDQPVAETELECGTAREGQRHSLSEDTAPSANENEDWRGLEGADLQAKLAALPPYQVPSQEDVAQIDDHNESRGESLEDYINEDRNDESQDGVPPIGANGADRDDADNEDDASSTCTIATRSPSPNRNLPADYEATFAHRYKFLGSFTTLNGANQQAYECAKEIFKPQYPWMDAQFRYERCVQDHKNERETKDLHTEYVQLDYAGPDYHGPDERRPHDFVKASIWVERTQLQGPRETGCDFVTDLRDDFTGVEISAEAARRKAGEATKGAARDSDEAENEFESDGHESDADGGISEEE